MRGMMRLALLGVPGAQGGADWSLEVTEFEQQTGANLVSNGDFEIGDPPTGWSAQASTTISTAAEERPGGSGSACINVSANTASFDRHAFQNIAPSQHVGKWALVDAWMRNVDTARGPRLGLYQAFQTHMPYPPPNHTSTSWARAGILSRVTTGNHFVRLFADSEGGEINQSARFDDVRFRVVTPREQITAPRANMDIEVDLDLPDSDTYMGQAIFVLYRAAEDIETSGNFWSASITRNKTADNWSFELRSWAAGIPTSRATLNDIGTPDTLRICAYGAKHQCFMIAGDIETPLHEVLELDYLTDQTGINVVFGEAMAPTSLRARASSPFESGLSGSSLMFIDGDSKSDPTDSYGHWDFMLKYLAERDTGSNWSYYNVAEAGRTLAAGLAALPTSLAALADSPAPDVALINFGANDVQTAQVEVTWKQALRDYVETLHTKWATTELFLMRPWREGYDTEANAICQWIEDVASEYAYVHLGPDERVWFKPDSALWDSGQGVHYNGAGNRACALQWAHAAIGKTFVTLPQLLVPDGATLLEDFESAEEWSVLVAGSGAVSDDATYSRSGTQSVKITALSGTSCTIRKEGVSLDCSTAQYFRLWAYRHNADTLTNIFLTLGQGGFINRFDLNIAPSESAHQYGNALLVTRDAFIPVGTADWAQPITHLQLRLNYPDGQLPVVSVDRLELLTALPLPAVLLTFDDGHISNYTYAFATMRDRDIPATAYLVTDQVDTALRISVLQAQEMHAAGWDMANHTKSHPTLTELDQAAQESELSAGQAALDGWGFTRSSRHVAYPGGHFDDTTLAAMAETGMLTGRSLITGYPQIPPGADYTIERQTVSGRTLEQVKAFVDSAIANGRVLCLLFHEIVESEPGAGQWSIGDYQALIDYIQAQHIQPLTISQFYALQSGPVTVKRPW